MTNENQEHIVVTFEQAKLIFGGLVGYYSPIDDEQVLDDGDDTAP